MAGYRGAVFLFVLLGVCCLHVPVAVAKRKSAKDWNSLSETDWEALEDEWENGDNAEELETEDMVQIRRMDEMREKLTNEPLDTDNIDMSNPHAFAAQQNNPGGPAMMFATMMSAKADGSAWTKDDTIETGGKWKELAHTGGLDITCYDIADDKLLVTLQRGWEGALLKTFILQQPEVIELEWDQAKYYPPSLSKKPQKKFKSKKGKKGKKGAEL